MKKGINLIGKLIPNKLKTECSNIYRNVSKYYTVPYNFPRDKYIGEEFIETVRAKIYILKNRHGSNNWLLNK